MRIFLAGATGVIGQNLLPLLINVGHEVVAMTRSPEKVGALKLVGAIPVVCDAFDAQAVRSAIIHAAPEIIIDELTDLPNSLDELPKHSLLNAKIRREGTRNLLDAAKAANVKAFIVQSVAWDMQGEGAAAVAYMEYEVLNYGGVVVRYGQLYGPGTFYETDKPQKPRIAVHEAAERTMALLTAPCGVVTLVES